MFEICLKIKTKTLQWRQRRFGVYVADFEQISSIVLMIL